MSVSASPHRSSTIINIAMAMIGICIIIVIHQRKSELPLPSTSKSRTITTINIEKIQVIPSLKSVPNDYQNIVLKSVPTIIKTFSKCQLSIKPDVLIYQPKYRNIGDNIGLICH
jgi:hypothetical protein